MDPPLSEALSSFFIAAVGVVGAGGGSVVDCWFEANGPWLTFVASEMDAAVLVSDGSGVTVTNCTFSDISGVALFGAHVDGLRISNCEFYRNGAGVSTSESEAGVQIKDCTFSKNVSSIFFVSLILGWYAFFSSEYM